MIALELGFIEVILGLFKGGYTPPPVIETAPPPPPPPPAPRPEGRPEETAAPLEEGRGDARRRKGTKGLLGSLLGSNGSGGKTLLGE